MKQILTCLLLFLGLTFSAEAATLSRQSLGDSATGLEATYSNANSGGNDVATNTDGKLLLHVKNPGASSATVTVTAQSATTTKAGYGTVTRANVVVALDAGEEAFIGPLPIDAFNNSSGQVVVTYGGAGAADVDIAALKLP